MTENGVRILVAEDGSSAAHAALERAVAIVKDRGGAIDLLHVIDTRQYSVSLGEGADVSGKVLYNAEQRAEVALTDMAEPLRKEGLRVNIHLRFGSPRSVVAYDAPKDYETTLIILGRSSKRLVSRMFIGSVAGFVVENAPCDVLIVANPEAAED
ncbi:universal stress protein [Lacticaseibacillus yichunensis]|uniref:Universal stress protein n=1 Tax=Lacticaseibacillus yichunensis TaxID=2486015 RepID=A0ABW4CTA7_9LACO|nr:universal stress protein [Lacticaseibacillus yichunensis]